MHLATSVRRAAGVLAATALGASSLALTAPSASAAPSPETQVGYLAQAYGSYVHSGDGTISSGPTGYTGLACTTQGGRHSSNNTAETNLGSLAHVGATETSVRSIDKGDVKASLATSQTAESTALSGLVKVGVVTSKSEAIKGPDGYRAEQSSKVASLSIAGHTIDLATRPNSRIALRLPLLGTIGYIELNTQEHRTVGSEYRVATTAVHIAVLDDAKVSLSKAHLVRGGSALMLRPGNQLTLLGGTHIRLGVTRAHLQQPQLGYLNGEGFGTQVKLLGGLVKSGKTAAASLACGGGAANNSIGSVDVPGVANVGAVTTHAQGTVGTTTINGLVTNETAGVDLLDGLIHADAIKAVARASRPAAGGTVSLSDEGSKLAGLEINGKSIAELDVRPNTTITIAGIAKVTLHKVVKTKTSIAVTQIEVKLLEDRPGLKIGSTIQVGYARAGVHS